MPDEDMNNIFEEIENNENENNLEENDYEIQFSETISSGCSMRIFRDEEYMNPNNLDIYLDINEIPANIAKENLSELKYRLQKLMPLSKILHLNLLNNVSRELSNQNQFKITNSLKIQNKKVNIK